LKIIFALLFIAAHLFADIIFPDNTPKTMLPIIKHGWHNAKNECLQKFFDQNSPRFMQDFKKLMQKPLAALPPEAYIADGLARWEKYHTIIEPPHTTREEERKRLQLEIKYDIRFDQYNLFLSVSPTKMRQALLYIKYLENKRLYPDALLVYLLIADRYREVLHTVREDIFFAIVREVYESDLRDALYDSLSTGGYSIPQMQALQKRLTKALLLSPGIYDRLLTEEKRLTIARLRMTLLDGSSFEAVFPTSTSLDSLYEVIDKETLQKHFEDKTLMKRIIGEQTRQIDETAKQLRSIQKESDLNRLNTSKEQEMENFRNEIQTLQEGRQLSEEEIVKYAGKLLYLYSRFWIVGKFKFTYDREIEANQELLDTFTLKIIEKRNGGNALSVQ